MRNKFICSVLFFSVLTSMKAATPVTVFAANSGYYDYVILNQEAKINYCDTTIEGDITIPSNLGGCPVTSIADNAFLDCDNLTSVIIPSSVASIGGYAFSECDNLTSIIVDERNANYSSSDGSLFDKDRTTLIQYPLGKTDAQYTIPFGVTTITDGAFDGCKSLEGITIPESVTNIGVGAFAHCSKLTNITADENNAHFSSFEGNLYSRDKTILIQYAIGKTDTQYNILNKVKSIGMYAFDGCSSLINVTIPNSVISMSRYAFCACKNLKSITIGNSVTQIDAFGFYSCSELTDVYYGGSEESWNNMSISFGNSYLTDANVHFNYDMPRIIAYNANGGINAPENQEGYANSNVMISLVEPSRTGYTFLGWATSAGADEVEYESASRMEVKEENVILYAVWERTAFTNTVNTNGSFFTTPNGIPVGSSILFVCYKNKHLVHMDIYEYDGTPTVQFLPSGSFDEIKVFVWENTGSILPLTEPEYVI